MHSDSPAVSGDVVDRGDAAPMVPRGGLGGVSLVLLCLAVFLPGFFGLPPIDRESRFAQASRQMFESVALPESQRSPAIHGGGLVVPRLQDRASAGSGPLGHWVQAATAAILSGGNPYRDSIWMYRLPSLIAAIVVVMLTRRIGGTLFDSGVGRLAAVCIAVCPVMSWEARQADAGMMGLAWTTAAMWGLWRAFAGGQTDPGGRALVPPLGRTSAAVFWLTIAGGVLTTGLVTLAVVGVAALFLGLTSRRWDWVRELRPLTGIVFAGAPVALWAFAAGTQMGFDQLINAMGRTLLWSDAAAWWPPGVHLLLMPILLWPATLLLATGLVVAWVLGVGPTRGASVAVGNGHTPLRERLRSGHPGYLFVFAWIAPAWMMLELLPGKSPSSALAIYPALAILAARALLAAGAGALPGLESRVALLSRVLWLVVGSGLVLGSLGIIAVRLVIWPGSAIGTAAAVALAILAGLIMFRALGASWRSIVRGQHVRAALAGSGVMVLIGLIVPTLALPLCLGLSTAVNSELERIDASGARPVAAIGCDSDSLVFLTRGRLARLDANAADAWVARNPMGILVRDQTAPFDGANLKELGSAAGLDYSGWRVMRVAIEALER